MGQLRIILSLEDKGPATALTSTCGPDGVLVGAPLGAKDNSAPDSLPQGTRGGALRGKGAAANPGNREGGNTMMTSAGATLQLCTHPQPHGNDVIAGADRPEAPVPQVTGAGSQPGASPVVGSREVEAVWELELWRKMEEAKWKAECKERMLQRMNLLENEWRRKLGEQEEEVEKWREEQVKLEDKTRKVLAAVEERERKLILAEEGIIRRSKDMEREHAARMTEAEAAVRRLQVECEHQLTIERDRAAEVLRQKQLVEQRLVAAEEHAKVVDQSFKDYKERQRNTPEEQLKQMVSTLKQDLKKAEERAARAAKGKKEYKEQVVRLVHELSTLHKSYQDQALALQQLQHQQKPSTHDDSKSTLWRPGSISADPYCQSQKTALEEIKRDLQALRGQVGKEQTMHQGPDPLAQQYRKDTSTDLKAAHTSDVAAEEAIAPHCPSIADAAEESIEESPLLMCHALSEQEEPEKRQDTTTDSGSSTLGDIERLVREKAILMQTGVYDDSDPVILQLQDRILELSKSLK